MGTRSHLIRVEAAGGERCRLGPLRTVGAIGVQGSAIEPAAQLRGRKLNRRLGRAQRRGQASTQARAGADIPDAGQCPGDSTGGTESSRPGALTAELVVSRGGDGRASVPRVIVGRPYSLATGGTKTAGNEQRHGGTPGFAPVDDPVESPVLGPALTPASVTLPPQVE
jgi:hypothetical protein